MCSKFLVQMHVMLIVWIDAFTLTFFHDVYSGEFIS
ncbi:hypothetical protein KCQ_18897 [Pectobacterium atrosepticum ICMP 1526]|nr:hypothetical protein KCQ_18897 [Pectobacterium atrosepticum ICMP 1526]